MFLHGLHNNTFYQSVKFYPIRPLCREIFFWGVQRSQWGETPLRNNVPSLLFDGYELRAACLLLTVAAASGADSLLQRVRFLRAFKLSYRNGMTDGGLPFCRQLYVQPFMFLF